MRRGRSHRAFEGELRFPETEGADRPLVSIVTPTFNRADYLRWTINSVKNQTYRNFEHIIVDGSSTDGTLDLLRANEGSYPLRWQSAPDDGMYHAINTGLAEAKGDILCYLNSDDLYLPWTLDTVVRAFTQHPEYDFVFGDALAVDEDSGESRMYWIFPYDLDYIRRVGFLCQPAVFWRRRAFEALGPFDTTFRYVADCEYWMRAGESHRFMKVEELLAVERLHRATLREAIGNPLWKELEGIRSRFVTLTGPEHDARVAEHLARNARTVRRYNVRLLLQSFLPRPLRRGAWSNTLNSGLVRVERFRYVLRALVIGRRLPRLRWWTMRDIIRSKDRSILEPR